VRGTRDQLEIHSRNLIEFNNQRNTLYSEIGKDLISTSSGRERNGGDSLSCLRLPGGSILSVPSNGLRTPERSTSSQSPKLSPPLFPLSLIPRTKSLAQYLMFGDVDEMVRVSARDLLEECKALELDSLRDGAVDWLRK